MVARVALVTGGTRGIGAAVSARLAASGAIVVAAYHRDDAVATDFRVRTGVQAFQVDVGDADACGALVRRVHDEHGRVDLLVNNAGLLVECPSTETAPGEWDRVVAVNRSAAFHLCRAAIPVMRQQNSGRVAFLLDDHAGYITGSILTVDGGLSMGG